MVLKTTTLNTHDNKKRESRLDLNGPEEKPDVIASLIQMVLLTLLEGENLLNLCIFKTSLILRITKKRK